MAGTQKALDVGSWKLTAVMLGAITATGGGALRDVLLAEVPSILRVDFYATAALAGAAVLTAARAAGASPRAGALAGGITCFVLRILAVLSRWHLPVG